MITISITKLVLCLISLGLGCIGLGMSLSNLINILVDRHYDKLKKKLLANQKSEKSNNDPCKTNKS